MTYSVPETGVPAESTTPFNVSFPVVPQVGAPPFAINEVPTVFSVAPMPVKSAPVLASIRYLDPEVGVPDVIEAPTPRVSFDTGWFS